MQSPINAPEPAARSADVFCSIQRIVDETAALDRSLAVCGESVAVDDALAEITALLRATRRHGRKPSRRAKPAVA